MNFLDKIESQGIICVLNSNLTELRNSIKAKNNTIEVEAGAWSNAINYESDSLFEMAFVVSASIDSSKVYVVNDLVNKSYRIRNTNTTKQTITISVLMMKKPS